MRLRLRAYAKINWTLEVLGRRDDGYHELRTIFQTIALADELIVEPGEGEDQLTLAGGQEQRAVPVPADASNLALRAAAAYRAEAGASSVPPLAITLVKRILPAAGLGGGSSDAAAVLRAMDRLNPRPLGTARLEGIAARIGADVAFFVRGGTQLARGRGEILEPLADPPACWLVLLLLADADPRKTARLYGLLTPDDYADGSRTARLAETLHAGRPPSPELLYNSFARAAESAFPWARAARDALERLCGRAVLCGAGPSLFAPAPSQEVAQRWAAELRPAFPAVVTCTVDSAEAGGAFLLDG